MQDLIDHRIVVGLAVEPPKTGPINLNLTRLKLWQD